MIKALMVFGSCALICLLFCSILACICHSEIKRRREEKLEAIDTVIESVRNIWKK